MCKLQSSLWTLRSFPTLCEAFGLYPIPVESRRPEAFTGVDALLVVLRKACQSYAHDNYDYVCSVAEIPFPMGFLKLWSGGW